MFSFQPRTNQRKPTVLPKPITGTVLPLVSPPIASSWLLIRAYLEPSLYPIIKLIHYIVCLRVWQIQVMAADVLAITSSKWIALPPHLDHLCLFPHYKFNDLKRISFSWMKFIQYGRNNNIRNTRRFYYSLCFLSKLSTLSPELDLSLSTKWIFGVCGQNTDTST